MALRWMDGFESYGLNATDVALAARYDNVLTNTTVSAFATGRYAGQSLEIAGGGFSTPVLATHATWVVGMAFKDRTIATGQTIPLISIMDGSATQVQLQYTKTGSLGVFSVSRGGITELGTGTTQISSDSWYFIEFKATIGSAGSFTLKINTVIELQASSVNTKITSNSTANLVRIGSSPEDFTGRVSIDDLYILDGSGGALDDFLGDSVVETLLPSGAGTTTMWTASPAVANYLNVDDVSPDGDTTYVTSSAASDIDLYAFGNLATVSGNVKGVSVNIVARNLDSTSHALQRVIRISSTNYTGSSMTLADTAYTTLTEILTADPSTSTTWGTTNINAMEVGIKYIS